jgi:hypothetical protein
MKEFRIHPWMVAGGMVGEEEDKSGIHPPHPISHLTINYSLPCLIVAIKIM